MFTGYRAATGTAAPTAATVNRVVSTLNASGVQDTSIAVTDLGTSVIRSATTVGGSTFYLGTAGSVRYVSTPSGAATSTVIDARNSRQVNLSGNTLYGANGSTAVTAKVQH